MVFICRNCDTILPYGCELSYGFCSPCCRADFAVKNNFTFNGAKQIGFYEDIDEIENERKILKGELIRYQEFAESSLNPLYASKMIIKIQDMYGL